MSSTDQPVEEVSKAVPATTTTTPKLNSVNYSHLGGFITNFLFTYGVGTLNVLPGTSDVGDISDKYQVSSRVLFIVYHFQGIFFSHNHFVLDRPLYHPLALRLVFGVLFSCLKLPLLLHKCCQNFARNVSNDVMRV